MDTLLIGPPKCVNLPAMTRRRDDLIDKFRIILEQTQNLIPLFLGLGKINDDIDDHIL